MSNDTSAEHKNGYYWISLRPGFVEICEVDGPTIVFSARAERLSLDELRETYPKARIYPADRPTPAWLRKHGTPV